MCSRVQNLNDLLLAIVRVHGAATLFLYDSELMLKFSNLFSPCAAGLN